MDLIKFFTREEIIAVLEISANHLRLTVLSQEKEDKKSSAAFAAEEPLQEGALVNGHIVNKEEFIQSIKRLIGKSKTRIRYVILSIPDDKVFSKIFKFPKNIKDEKLKGTMELSIGFQLPIRPADAYLDWEKVEKETGDENEVLLAAVPKLIVNDYVAAVESAGLKIIAVEFHLLSIARAIPPNDETVLVLKDNKEGMTTGVIKNNLLLFIHTISYETTPKDKLPTELKKVINFCEAEYGTLSKVLVPNEEAIGLIGNLGNLKVEIANIVKTSPDTKEPVTIPGSWLVSLGAATRGLMPRNQDNLVSLMPVGTEEAYEYHKAITFSKLVTEITISVSFVFLAVFLGAWFLMLYIQQSLNNQYSLSANLPVPIEAAGLEARATHLNALLSQTTEIIKTAPQWSEIISEITNMVGTDIVVGEIDTKSPDAPITLQGTAKSRDALNNLTKSFQASLKFTDVNVPLTDLEKKKDIPFSMSFRLKDPQSLYLK